MTKVSIIVPVYNTEKYLEKCINSLLNQTLSDIEILMVNDGSVDGSEEIIQKFQQKDSRVILINKSNGGQASARNLGLSKATGEYIAFIDSDDYADYNFCEKLYTKAISGNYDIICCDYFIIDGAKEVYFNVFDFESCELSASEYAFSGAGPCNKMYKRSFLQEHGFVFPEGIIYEDYACIPALVVYNPNVFYCKEPLFYYVHHNASTMRSDQYKQKYEDIFKASDILYQKMKDTEYYLELESLICNHLLYLGALNFYKYDRFEQIDRISSFMKKRFPNWKNNKYVKKCPKKERLLMSLFYHKKYNIISLCQKIKKRCGHER